VRDQWQPVSQPPVDVVGDVLGPVGADLVAERHPGGHDEMIRPEVHGAQVHERVHARGALDLVADQLQLFRVGGATDEKVSAVQAELDRHHDEQGADGDGGRAVPDR
jgi:hypothetical protein